MTNDSTAILEIHPTQAGDAVVVFFPMASHRYMKSMTPDHFKAVRETVIGAVTAAFDNFNNLKFSKELDPILNPPARGQHDTDVH